MLKLSKLSCLAICFAIVFTSCKKKENTTEEPAPTTTGSTTTPTVAPETHYIPADFNDANGMLVITKSVTKQTTASSSSESSSNYGTAKFTTTPNNFTTMVDAGSVSVNASSFTQNPDYSYYNISTFLFSSPIATWSVAGTPTISAFTYSLATPIVTTPTTNITVNKASGFAFNFSSITNKDSISILIKTQFASTVTATTVEKKYLHSATSASFSPAELLALPTGTCDMVIKCKKYAKDTVSGKYFYFINNTVFTQNVIVN